MRANLDDRSPVGYCFGQSGILGTKVYLLASGRRSDLATPYDKGTPMSAEILHVTDDNFDAEVLSNDLPVLVDFWAEWCGPCKMIAPILEEIATEYAGKVKVCKVDVDANPDMPAKFNIRGIPTLILFKGGNAVDTKVGALSKTQLAEFLDSAA